MLTLPPLVQTIITFGTLALLAGIAFAMFKKGNRTESGEQIKFYKEESTTYRDMLTRKEEKHAQEIKDLTADFHSKFTKLSQDFGILQGQYIAEKEAREKAEAILKDRNPETEKFMKSTIGVLGEIKDFMEKINKHMEQDIQIESRITHPAPTTP